MTSPVELLRRALVPVVAGLAILALGAAAPAPSSIADRKYEVAPVVVREAIEVMNYLNQAHLNRGAVAQADFGKVIEEYMGDLDQRRLFFLASDLDELRAKHDRGTALYANLTRGNLDAGFDIFTTYARRAEGRIKWIVDELKRPITLTGTETYAVDRTKAPWPKTAAEADDLWRRRLKYELLAELLGQKTVTVRYDVNVRPGTQEAGAAANAPRPPSPPPSLQTVTVVNPALTNPNLSQALKDALNKPKSTTETNAVILLDDPKLAAEFAEALRNPPPPASPSMVTALEPMKRAVEVVTKRYERLLKDIGETESLDIAETYLTSVSQLYDPHSSYMSPDSYQEFGIQIRLELVGIGAVLESKDDFCIIKELIPGGPASLSGLLKEEDKILAVSQDGTAPVEVIGMKLRKIVQMIRGTKDTNVHLLIERHGDERKEVVIKRDLVKLDNQRAHGAIFDVPTPGGATSPIGVITLPTFYGGDADPAGPSATRDVAELLKRMREGGAEGIVLDLRRNGGGLLNEAIGLAGLFIERGPIVQVQNYDKRVQRSDDENPSVAYTGPLAVLVDRFSASASEIVAGALQNYGRAVVIGDSSTHGKGTVQTLIPLTPATSRFSATAAPTRNGAVKLTVQKFYLPNGSSTQRNGVVPDIVLPSFYEFLPNIGEKDLPHALEWDVISSTLFDGRPIDPRGLSTLLAASRRRQGSLPEFSYLNRYIQWFKQDQEELKAISLNLAARQKEKQADDTFRKSMKAEFEQLEKNKFAFREVRLAPAPVRPRAVEEEDDLNVFGLDANGGYDGLDISLRESMRVLEDIIAANRPTAATRAAGGPAPIAVYRPKNG